jgi:tRNA-2-methylthio-N6-dimethylallyladenosine synthase
VAAVKGESWGLVPQETKVERLERLQTLQRRISGEILAALVGQEVEVLVEGPSRSNPSRRFGRTPENRTVNFDGEAPVGARARVRVSRASPDALSGAQSGLVDLPPVLPSQRPRPEAA